MTFIRKPFNKVIKYVYFSISVLLRGNNKYDFCRRHKGFRKNKLYLIQSQYTNPYITLRYLGIKFRFSQKWFWLISKLSTCVSSCNFLPSSWEMFVFPSVLFFFPMQQWVCTDWSLLSLDSYVHCRLLSTSLFLLLSVSNVLSKSLVSSSFLQTHCKQKHKNYRMAKWKTLSSCIWSKL